MKAQPVGIQLMIAHALSRTIAPPRSAVDMAFSAHCLRSGTKGIAAHQLS
jgi:hypothetical protein